MNRTSGTFRRVTGAALALSVGLVLVVSGTAQAATSVKGKAALADAPLPFAFATTGWTLADIPDGQKPYQASTAASLSDPKPHDANGVRKFVLNGKTYDHPQGQAALGLSMLDGYRVTKNQKYLDIALANASRLVATKVVDTTVVSDGAWFFPYRFDFALHRYPAFTMKAPWYSGMAQGQANVVPAIQQAFRTAIVPDQSDRTYRALTHAQIVALANAYRPRRAREDTVMDCDDYTRGYLGWLSENGYGNCSHGFLGYQAYDVFGRHLGAHAVTVSVDVDRRVWMVDHMPGRDGRFHDDRTSGCPIGMEARAWDRPRARWRGGTWSTMWPIVRKRSGRPRNRSGMRRLGDIFFRLLGQCGQFSF